MKFRKRLFQKHILCLQILIETLDLFKGSHVLQGNDKVVKKGSQKFAIILIIIVPRHLKSQSKQTAIGLVHAEGHSHQYTWRKT